MTFNIAIVAAELETVSSLQRILEGEDEIRTTVIQPERDPAIRTARNADVLLLDHELSDDTIFHILRALMELPGETRPILVNAPDDPSRLVRYLERGVVGYVFASEPSERIAEVAHSVLHNGACIQPDAVHALIERYRELSRMTNRAKTRVISRDSEL